VSRTLASAHGSQCARRRRPATSRPDPLRLALPAAHPLVVARVRDARFRVPHLLGDVAQAATDAGSDRPRLVPDGVARIVRVLRQSVGVLLRQFQVTAFRNVIDSGPIAVDESVTCLVGKNESGKTALLEALRRIHPVYAAAFDASEHYPRWLLTTARRRGQIDGTVAARATFDLDAEDLAEVERRYGEGVPAVSQRQGGSGLRVTAAHGPGPRQVENGCKGA
jgi:hypothetical protein